MDVTSRHEAVRALAARDLPDNPPDGFRPIATREGFHTMMGQFHGRMEHGMLVLGFRCSPRHMNNHGACHGGMLACFADFAAYSVRLSAGLHDTSIPTVSLTTEYLRPVRLGDWIEARVEVTRRGRNLLFSRVVASVSGKAVFTSTGIFSIGPDDKGGLDVLEAARAP